METTLYRLVNPEFDFEFNGKVYRLRKANLDKAVQYQTKIKELAGDPAQDAKLLGFCVYIMLKDQEPEITQDIVIENIPGDVDIIECLTQLGFINPTKTAMAKKVQEAMLEKITTKDSTPFS